METTKDITETNTLEQLYKSNIDVRINYLQTLNSRMSISRASFMEIAPTLEKIRDDLYQKSIFNNGEHYIPTIATFIKIRLKFLLVDYHLFDASEYIDYNLDAKEVCNLTTAVFLNNILESLPEVVKGDSVIITAISSLINDLKKKIPMGTIEGPDIDSSLVEEYLCSLRLKYNNKDSLIRYIYEVISGLRGIIILLNRLENNCIDTEAVDSVCASFEENLTILDGAYLASVVDDIKNAINKINKQSVSLHL